MDSDNPDLYNTNDKNKKDKAGRGQELGQQERRLQQGLHHYRRQPDQDAWRPHHQDGRLGHIKDTVEQHPQHRRSKVCRIRHLKCLLWNRHGTLCVYGNTSLSVSTAHHRPVRHGQTQRKWPHLSRNLQGRLWITEQRSPGKCAATKASSAPSILQICPHIRPLETRDKTNPIHSCS